MASTSSSAIQKSFKYDVFLSFRGEDTRKNFVDHLYHALEKRNIITYKDDEKIVKGERINNQIIRSIKDSRFYIVVFSKNYASSSWCLDELVQIMECQRTNEQQTAYPIFYDVEPTEVRHQSGAVGKALAKHEKRNWNAFLPLDHLCSIVAYFCNGLSSSSDVSSVDLENEDIARWSSAMQEAAGLAGMELKNTFSGHEAKFIQQLVQEISLKLHFVNSIIDGKLVGMETRVKSVVSSLESCLDDVRMIGIKGMGGGGKTTLARAVFDHISVLFEGASFVENVREISKGSSTGLKEMQKQVLNNVLTDQNINVTSVFDGKKKMKMMMPSRKALLVLDDVNDINQLEALAGELTWFKPGSRIIITTRDEQVLIAHGVNIIHDVNLLSHEEAICLFSRHAFRKEFPNQGYEKISRKVIRYAAGLPLTIKVLGSHLCGRVEPEWVDTIERLKTIPLKETLEKLELTYNGLEDDQKEIFLDVVCLLKGEKKDRAIRILESCGFKAQIGLRVLEQKSLITITDLGCLGFHDHIEEMGRNIVRRLHPNKPSRHSRLWIREEIEDILLNESGSEETKCLKLKNTFLNSTVILKGLSRMKELRLLYVSDVKVINYLQEDDDVRQYSPEDDEVSQYLPNALQCLFWTKYPFQCLPKTLQADNLVNLEMRQSKISKLWEGGERKVLHKLKFVDFGYSRLRTFDLREAPHLEVLHLDGCKNFEELHFPIECPNLKVINLNGSKVSNLNLGMNLHLEELSLVGCKHLVELQLPVECPNLKILHLSGSKLSSLELGMTLHLEELNLEGCSDLFELHMTVECPNLKLLNLSGCMVSSVNLGLTPHLKRLYLEECSHLQEIHAPVGCLKKLLYFRLTQCLNFTYFNVDKKHKSADFNSIDTLKINVDCVDVCPLHPKNNLPRFGFTCNYDEPSPSWSGTLEKLISFGQCVCKNLEHILATICGLQHVRELTLEKSMPPDLRQLEILQKLSLKHHQFQHLPDSICMLRNLKSLQLYYCLVLEQLPENICRLECLEDLIIWYSKSLRDIPKNICKMKCLKRLELAYCHKIMNLPEELGHLECLKELWIEGTGISRLPQSIYQLKGMRIYGSMKQLESFGFTSFPEEFSIFVYVDL